MSDGSQDPAVPSGTEVTFDTVVVPHLEAARRLARWLMRDADDAEDAVQDASLRAFRYFRTFVHGDGRAWFLKIVRNTCYSRKRHRYQPPADLFDEEQHSSEVPQSDPERLLLQIDDAAVISEALARLPDHFHQLLVLRELEGLSYRELSDVVGIPMGTVMSRLSRAREALRQALGADAPRPHIPSRGLPKADVSITPDDRTCVSAFASEAFESATTDASRSTRRTHCRSTAALPERRWRGDADETRAAPRGPAPPDRTTSTSTASIATA